MTSARQEEPSLLDTQAVADVELATSFYYLTNRFNLLDILSAGFIGPLGMHWGKHYQDFLEYCPGRIPLFQSAPGASAASLVSSELDTAYPVAFEVRAPWLSESVVLGPSAGVRCKEGEQDFLAVDWPIPLACVRSLHFRTAEELDEHLARRDQFANVDLAEIEATVTPGLFEEGPDAQVLIDWLSSLSATAEADGTTLRRLDQLAGAAFLVAQAAPPERDGFEVLAAVMEAFASREVPVGVGSSPLCALFREQRLQDTDSSTEHVLFALCADVLRLEQVTGGSGNRGVLAAIRDRLAETSLTPLAIEEAQTMLDHIEALLLGEREFRPFRAGRGWDALKALCLALMRPDPEALLAWPSDETGADQIVEMEAAALVGLRTGGKGLPLALRPRQLRDYVIDQQCRRLGTPTAAGRARLIVVETQGEQGEVRLDLSTEGRVVFSKLRPAPSLLSLMQAADLARSRGQEAALLLARKLQWFDCVETRVSFGRDSFQMSPGKGRLIELRAVGKVGIEEGVLREPLLDRLAKEPDLPPTVEDEARQILLGRAPSTIDTDQAQPEA